MHPIVFVLTLVIAGVAGAGFVKMRKAVPPETKVIPQQFSAVGIKISPKIADGYYNAFANHYGPEKVRYMTLSLDDLNDMNVVYQNATNGKHDIKEFKLYYGQDAAGQDFLMVSGITDNGNVMDPVYQLVPDKKVGPCPEICDAGRGLPPPF